MDISTRKRNVREFIEEWKDRGREKQDSQSFWLSLLRDVLGVEKPEEVIRFEEKVKLAHDSFIDGYIDQTHTMIEQKGADKDLDKAIKQSDGSLLTPYQQAFRYSIALPYSKRPRWIITCNFKEFRIYDMEHPNSEPTKIELKDLEENLHSLNFLIDKSVIRIQKQQQLSVDAGKLVSKMYSELLNIFSNYPDFDKEKVTHSINELCVRLVFCLYAEDSGLFDKTTAFYDYLKDVEPNKIGLKLKELFKVLNTKREDRNKNDAFWTAEHPTLDAFPYVNGGLFANTDIIIPPFTAKLKDILLNQASRGFNWKDISPTIFGAVFESTLNPETRRQKGMHYTSIENIHKVIDPLFLDDLKADLQQLQDKYKVTEAKLTGKQKESLKKDVEDYQEKLANYTFFDPACGSGNFLTETYLQLRKLENEALKLVHPNPELDVGQVKELIKVSIQHFFGIEINDFAVAVAKTALWIAEAQMWDETRELFFANVNAEDFLPLKTYTHIHKGNALTMDWNKVIDNYGCDYLLGNPPFVGPQKLNKEQKEDRANIFKGVKRFGLLDYVSCWYAKAVDYMQGTHMQTAFVSTNSIVQGSQVPVLWQYLLNKGVQINFAYRSFPWESRLEVNDKNKAQVICVIIGFSLYKLNKPKYIFEGQNKYQVKNISPYLTDSDSVFVTARQNPISHVPKIMKGTSLSDNNLYLFTYDEMQKFVAKEPKSKFLFHEYYMGRDFLYRKPRYVLWFKGTEPNQLRKMPLVMDRVKEVKEFRTQAGGRDTTRYKDEPLRPTFYRYYSTEHKGDALVIPVLFAPRDYIPMDIVDKEAICGIDTFLTEVHSPYMFGVLESKVHTAWTKLLCNRLGNGIRYSNTIIYNNFPFPNTTDEQKEKIEQTAQAILDARANHPNDSLADLYDPRGLMPSDLRKAHQANDKAVLKAYGLSTKATESEIVAHLFKMYEKLTKNEK